MDQDQALSFQIEVNQEVSLVIRKKTLFIMMKIKMGIKNLVYQITIQQANHKVHYCLEL